ncbi:hypothetical protein [Bacillus phage SWEP1]|nr:hypothetical protein [Bacillus phage SWEP1]
MGKINIGKLKREADKLKLICEGLKGHYCTLPSVVLGLSWLPNSRIHCKIREVDLFEGYVGVEFLDPDPDPDDEVLELVEYVPIATFNITVRWGWVEEWSCNE